MKIGAVIGPLLCGLIAQVYGWHYGFGIAAIFMLFGLATYLYGYRYLPARVERRKYEGTSTHRGERRIVVALIAVLIISIFESMLPSSSTCVDQDSTARRARPGRLPDPGALVPIDQFGFQHR